MRYIFGWVLSVLGLMLAIGGAGMIPIGFSTKKMDVAGAGGVWVVLGLIATFIGFRLRADPSRTDRR